MSNITLGNNTQFIAQYVVLNGEQVIARIPGIQPGAQLLVPTNDTYQVIATTVINGNTYISAPIDVTGPTNFLAQVVQVPSQGTYEFNVVELPSTNPNQLQFQKTTIGPVTFTITKDGIPLQTVVVNDAFQIQTVAIGDTFSIFAVINGVTTATVVTTNPNATVVANTDTSALESGYFTLVLS
ncbi:hypothetical protein [Pseudoxanthomonas wuyuanensis]